MRVYSFLVCSTNQIWATHTATYRFPTYPDTDGVVSASSARAEGSAWRGVAIEAPDTDHGTLNNLESEADFLLRSIFDGTNAEIPFGQRGNFQLIP